MLSKRIIPCLDVDQGRVVKGTNFVNLRDAGDPVEVATRYEQEGADELVFLDITASHEGRGIILDVVQRTADVVFMPLCVGGVSDGLLPLVDIHLPRLGVASFAGLGLLFAWSLFRFGHSFAASGSFSGQVLAGLPDGVVLATTAGRIRYANLVGRRNGPDFR